MGNTIREKLEKKKQECKNSKNRFNILDLCKITVTKDNKARCINYAKCMQNKCKTCKEREKCENESNRENNR